MAKEGHSEKEQEGGFRFVDRRRFTEEGDSRSGREEQQKDHEPSSSVSAASEPSVSKSGDAPTQQAASESDAKQEHSDQQAQQPRSVTFEMFIQSLGQQAMMAMGLLPWPDSGLVKTDLQRAREMIDLIALLHEKTKGNLTPDEQKLCEALLYQLRVTFVQIVQKGGAQPPAAPDSTPGQKTG